ncbi:uncharacterized protein LOC106674387 isoform X2 [Cimex lectularius]|nr:uncharacterized protein LOC106674387 isoform X2 [Cimex lectularius]
METRLVNFYQCPDKPNIPVVWKDMVVKRINAKESRLYGEITVSKTIKDMKLLLEMYKCASKSETHTCEYYTSLKLSSVCDKIEKKASPWYQYWNRTELPKTCPVHAGTYAVHGVKVGMDTVFPLFEAYWKFKNKGMNEKGNLLNCFFMEIDIHKRYKL